MQKESGLSEVIGFILIIAILVVIASLYVTYVVPAHGREAEIAHMTYVKNQFVDFKMAMDSLWINSQVNTSISQNIEMGTLGQKTEGQFIFLPLTQPIGSDGEMGVSTDRNDGTIQIEVAGLIKEAQYLTPKGGKSPITINPDIYTQMLLFQSLYPAEVKNMIMIPVPVPLSSTDPYGIPQSANDFAYNQSILYSLANITPASSTPSTAKWIASFNLVRTPGFSVPVTMLLFSLLRKVPTI